MFGPAQLRSVAGEGELASGLSVRALIHDAAHGLRKARRTDTVEDDLADIYRKPHPDNGMYVSYPAMLAQMLLYGEDVAPLISTRTPSDLRVSRVTFSIRTSRGPFAGWAMR